MSLSIRRRSPFRARRGFSLVEIMMAMTMLCIVLLSLGKVTYLLSKRGRDNGIIAKRTFAIIKEANKFGAMPYATLTAFSTANKTVTDGGFTYTRRLSITTSGSQTTVKIAIVPALDATRVDSVFVYRTKPATSPLCTTC
jgi:prepilin-type N-terminal cleavage/methylation domain-containing protein